MGLTDPAGLRIGGVPEHFNFPWHLAIESGCLPAGIGKVTWIDYPSGSGAMLQGLVDGAIDLAPLLTEGAALGVARGAPIEVVSLYTTSPLIWGIHVAPDSRFETLADLRGARFAISRNGSGSHLMSLALAIDRGWPVGDIEFDVVGDMAGAAAALRDGRADVFLWEHFTTEPQIEAGAFRRIDDFTSPWPAWVLCAGTAVWRRRDRELTELFESVIRCASHLVTDPNRAAKIARRYGLRESAVSAWLETTRWVTGMTPAGAAISAATSMLRTAGVSLSS